MIAVVYALVLVVVERFAGAFLTFGVVAALLVHELGHAAIGSGFGYPVRGRLTWHGPAVIVGSDELVLSRPAAIASLLAGPAASLLLAGGTVLAVLVAHTPHTSTVQLLELAAVSLELGVVNLVAGRRSDGGAALLWALGRNDARIHARNAGASKRGLSVNDGEKMGAA